MTSPDQTEPVKVSFRFFTALHCNVAVKRGYFAAVFVSSQVLTLAEERQYAFVEEGQETMTWNCRLLTGSDLEESHIKISGPYNREMWPIRDTSAGEAYYSSVTQPSVALLTFLMYL